MPAHALAPAEEARAEHVVRASTRHGIEHPREVRGVVLAVAVEVDRGAIALVSRELEPGAKRGAEPARDRMRDHARAVLPADLGRAIARAVIDEQDVDWKPTRLLWDATNDGTHSNLLVPGHNNRQAPFFLGNPD